MSGSQCGLCVGLQRKAKGSKQAEPSLQMLDIATARDVALDPFHAIGKILYNKRGEEGSEVCTLSARLDSLCTSNCL